MMKAVVHHTASFAKPDSRQLHAIDRHHKERFGRISFLGYWVGYHYLIEPSGAFEQTRSIDERGYHTYDERTGKDYGDYIGIALAGNFNLQDPTKKQLDALRRILISDLRIKRKDVFLHRDLDQTACPGSGITHEVIDKIYEKSKDITAARRLLLKGRRYLKLALRLIYKHK